MCTTYLGAVLARRLIREHMKVREARLVRLNPNVTFKTRGNAAIMLDVEGDPDRAFAIACSLVKELADFSCENTNPGVVVVEKPPDPAFYEKAVKDFCEIEDAIHILDTAGALYRGWKNRRGLIGATAAVSSRLKDRTSEVLVYREPASSVPPVGGSGQSVCRGRRHVPTHVGHRRPGERRRGLCATHPGPGSFRDPGREPGVGDGSPCMITSELPGLEQIWVTNQGTDAHLVDGTIGTLREGLSYLVPGPSGTGRRPGREGTYRLPSGMVSVQCGAWRTNPRKFPADRPPAQAGRYRDRLRELQEREHQPREDEDRLAREGRVVPATGLHHVQQADDERWERQGLEVQKVRRSCGSA